MSRHIFLTASLFLVLSSSFANAGHHWGYHPYSYHTYRPTVTYSHYTSMAYRPVFAAPTTVFVQRPVYVAHPVTVPQPVFVETPVIQTHVVQSPVTTVSSVMHAHPVAPAAVTVVPQTIPHHHTHGVTTVRYRGPLWPLGHRDKLRYRVDTPYGTHKYTYRRSWWNGTTKFEYDFDD